MRVLLAGRYDDEADGDDWLAALEAAMPEAAWTLTPDEEVEAAVVANPPPGSLRGLPRLKLIQSLWAGVDRLLADETLPAGVPIARMVDPMMSRAMAETALWAVLSLHRGFFAYADQQRAGVWQPRPQRRADEVRVTVLGLGEMGRAAARAIAERGYPVTAWRTREGDAVDGLRVRAGDAALEPLLARSDIVVNLLPLTPATRGLLDARRLSALPAGASLVNLARGAHVVEDDLLRALDAGLVAHAVLDVFAQEPLPAGHPFWTHPRVTLLPHIAALTDMRSASEVVARNLRALEAGDDIAHLVQDARGY